MRAADIGHAGVGYVLASFAYNVRALSYLNYVAQCAAPPEGLSILQKRALTCLLPSKLCAS
eukprot:3791750-Karenia_brevis.AAC.1